MDIVALRLALVALLLPIGAAAQDAGVTETSFASYAERPATSRLVPMPARKATGAVVPADLALSFAGSAPMRFAVGDLTTPLPGHGQDPDGFRAGLAFPALGRNPALQAELSWFEARAADARGAAEPDRDGLARRGLLLSISRKLGGR
ncbi:MAG: hypothetical protein V2J24_11030 [Pseudomonadales bacterium]|nr:hypothetical protein [Pseudomonadales bacterium]